MSQNELEDIELVTLLKMGNKKAFESIYSKYWESLFGFIFRNLGSKEETEEVLHEIMLALWKNRGSANIKSLGIYLFIAARNQINKFIRREINLRKYREFQIMHQVGEITHIEEEMDESLFKLKLELVLSRMPEKTALIFKMSKLEEIPVNKIAHKLDLSEKAIEYHITKSMKIIRENFKGSFSDN
jgi:RNA polymerase sigma-70 factor (ECF subfamily)